jgi:hypothetical protein
MLLGVEPGSYGRLFAEMQKLSKRVAKLRQCLKSLGVCRTYISSHIFKYIALRCGLIRIGDFAMKVCQRILDTYRDSIIQC